MPTYRRMEEKLRHFTAEKVLITHCANILDRRLGFRGLKLIQIFKVFSSLHQFQIVIRAENKQKIERERKRENWTQTRLHMKDRAAAGCENEQLFNNN